jgi:DNA polymerase-1
VDGHSLAYRAFFALPDTLATAEGEPTNAVLGFAQMLLRIIEEEKPDYVAVAFDKGRPAFRLDEYDQYKAQRKPTPDKLRPQFALIKEFLGALGAAVVELDGWEGDDILAALADLAKEGGVETLLLSGDRDTLQLVGPGVKAIITLRGISDTRLFDAQAVQERYGVEPARLPDLKGLVGDPSDNISGVPGVGPKTAVSLLARFGSLENLLDHVEEVTPDRLRDALKTYAEDARTYRSIATIRHDVPLEPSPSLDDLRYRGWDAARLADFLRRLEFRALLRRLGLAEKAAAAGTLFSFAPPAPAESGASAAPAAPTATARGRRVVQTRAGLAAVAGDLARVSRLALAARLDAERPLEARLTGLAVAGDGLPYTVYVPIASVPPGQAGASTAGAAGASGPVSALPPSSLFAEPVRTVPTDLGEGLSFTEVAEVLGPILAASEPAKVMHGAKPLRVWLAASPAAGPLSLGGLVLDTELGAYLLDASRARYTLESLTRELTGQDVLLLDQPPEGWTATAPGLDWPGERLCFDADMTLAIADPLRAQLVDKDLDSLLDDMEMPLEEVLASMEVAGIGVDVPALREMSVELGRRIDELTTGIYHLAGQEFNVNSPKQLGDVLFGRLKLPAGRKTSTGAYSTNAEVLEELAVSHEVVARILQHRQLSKLKGTYTDGLDPLVNRATGRLHTVFKQTVTTTGRLSSAEPNLQNIPIREEEGRRIRRVFIPARGTVFLAGDYSQIELRLMAHLSGDESFISAFLKGEDIHQRTASEIFGVPMAAVTPELRNRAKAVNFGIIYGVSDFGLARNTGVSREEAAAYIEGYLQRYPGIHGFVDHTLAEARRRGYVMTMWGRRRYVPELHSANRAQRQMAERAARNMPIQGTAADIIKLAMVGMAREMRERRLAARLILQVHDELLFEVPEAEVDAMSEMVKVRMAGVTSLDVPLVVDIKLGRNWYEMKKVG